MESRRGRKRSDVVLSPELRSKVEAARALQLEAVAAAQRSTAMWREITRELAATGMGMHDLARLLDVSPARIRDLLDDIR